MKRKTKDREKGENVKGHKDQPHNIRHRTIEEITCQFVSNVTHISHM